MDCSDTQYQRENRVKAVEDMIGGYQNVKIHILNNNNHTPSAPRNYGLELATAPYIAFLDADDSFTPRCLRDALFHIKKNNTQMVWFRREYELESKENIPVTEIVSVGPDPQGNHY